MKRNLCLWMAGALALAGIVLPAAAQDTSIKIAVVDLDTVVAQSSVGRQLQAKLEKFQTDAKAEIDVIGNKANDIRKRVAEGGNSLSEEKLAELQKEYEDQQIALRRLRDDKQREGQKLQQEGLREIEQKLQPVFEAIQSEKGFDLILNNVPGVVVMASPKVDITALVVERFNALNNSGDGG